MNGAITEAIINGSPNISVTIKASDLKAIITAMLRSEKDAIAAEERARNEKATLSRKEVMEKLGVSSTTLLRWQAEKYLIPVKVGRKVLYKASDINSILTKKVV